MNEQTIRELEEIQKALGEPEKDERYDRLAREMEETGE